MNEEIIFEECLENLKFTRDFDLYLDVLNALKDKYLIILCVKETSGEHISETSAAKIRSLGFSNFSTEHHILYLGIVNRGSIVCDGASRKENEPVRCEGTLENVSLVAVSAENAAEITINGTNWSLNERGLNFAVYDHETSEVIDVTCYDGCETFTPFYHRNFYFSDQYIDSHIYIPKRYIDQITISMKKSYFSNRELKVREIERGIFLPSKMDRHKVYGGICDENFNFFAGFQVLNSEKIDLNHRHIYGSYEVPLEEIEYIDETVVYGGSMMHHPGHLIVEAFAARIWWLEKNTDSNLKIAVEITWKTFFGENEYPFFPKQFFKTYGMPEDRIIFIEKPTKFKKIIIPDQSVFPFWSEYPYEFTTEFVQVFQHIKKRLTPGKDKKIYLTKTQTLKKNIVGEEYFIDFFKAKGFRIVVPEEYTIKEKAEIMYGADEVVTLDGSNAHYSIFCKPTVRLTVLSRLPDRWSITQQLVTEAAGIKDFYLVNISGNFIHHDFNLGMLLICITNEFKSYVKDIYGEEIDITLEESLKDHICEYLTRFAEHYSDIRYFNRIRNLKIWEILQNMSEVFLGRDFDTTSIRPDDTEILLARKVERQREENKLISEKLRVMTDHAKKFIDENANLKQVIAQLEAENEQLRRKNSEMSSFMAEINQLLGELEPENGMNSEE